MKKLGIVIALVVFTITLSQFLSIDTNASRYNLYLDYVYLEDRNHMVVRCYDPIAGKYVFVEPQTDKIIGYDEVATNFTIFRVWDTPMYYLNHRKCM